LAKRTKGVCAVIVLFETTFAEVPAAVELVPLSAVREERISVFTSRQRPLELLALLALQDLESVIVVSSAATLHRYAVGAAPVLAPHHALFLEYLLAVVAHLEQLDLFAVFDDSQELAVVGDRDRLPANRLPDRSSVVPCVGEPPFLCHVVHPEE
jgi:hypothetical protein